MFDPNESVDFQGHTGPFIQYTHARIRSVLNRAGVADEVLAKTYGQLASQELDLIVSLTQFPDVIQAAAEAYSPALIANYVYELAKIYNKFYHEKSILQAEDEASKQFRLPFIGSSWKSDQKRNGFIGN